MARAMKCWHLLSQRKNNYNIQETITFTIKIIALFLFSLYTFAKAHYELTMKTDIGQSLL